VVTEVGMKIKQRKEGVFIFLQSSRQQRNIALPSRQKYCQG